MDRTELEQIVASMHVAHYTPETPHGLWHPDEAPNTNTIYKVWNDGEITNEKGGHAFGERSKRSSAQPLVSGVDSVLPTFPLNGNGIHSYAILTMDECSAVRGMLKKLLAPYIFSRAEVRVRTDSKEVVRSLWMSFHELGLFVEHQSPVVVNPYVFVVRGKGDVAQTTRMGLGGMDADIFVY